MTRKKIGYTVPCVYWERYEFGHYSEVPDKRRKVLARETANYRVIPGAGAGTERRFWKDTGRECGMPERCTTWAYLDLDTRAQAPATVDV